MFYTRKASNCRTILKRFWHNAVWFCYCVFTCCLDHFVSCCPYILPFFCLPFLNLEMSVCHNDLIYLIFQMMSSLAAELDNMLYELGTTPAFPYGRLLEETEEEEDVDDEYRLVNLFCFFYIFENHSWSLSDVEINSGNETLLLIKQQNSERFKMNKIPSCSVFHSNFPNKTYWRICGAIINLKHIKLCQNQQFIFVLRIYISTAL